MNRASAPWLLCLNLNREYVTPGRPLHAQSGVKAAGSARTLLYGARERGWTVAHIQARRSRLANLNDFAQPIEDLEPLPCEPLYLVSKCSALTHLDLRARLSADRPPALFLIGFTLAQEGLATMFDAVDLGLAVRVVADAVASPPIGDRSSAEIDRAALAIAASLAEITISSEALSAKASVVVGLKGA